MEMPPPPLAAAPDQAVAKLSFVCALLLCASMFLLTGRGVFGAAARLALILFPATGAVAWLLLRRLRLPDAGGRDPRLFAWIGLPLLAWFLTAFAGMLIHADSAAVLDKPVRALLLGAGLFVWSRMRLDAGVLTRVAVGASILGGFFAIGTAIYERMALGADRVGVEIFPIQFADLAMSIVLLLAIWLVVVTARPVRVLAGLSGALAFAACAMTQSRGAFAALAVLPWILAYAAGRRVTLRMIAAVAGAVVLVIALALAGSAGFRHRLADVKNDMDAYSRGNPVTSLGMRLVMWQNSLQVFASAPLLGVGSRGYAQAQEAGVASGRLDKAILEYNGAHNQFIDALAKGGLLHFLSTCALFVFPWIWFRRRCRQSPAAIAGFALACAFPVFSLSQHVFNHSTGMMFYGAGIVLFGLAAQFAGTEPPLHGEIMRDWPGQPGVTQNRDKK